MSGDSSSPATHRAGSSGRPAILVATGIFLSRISGLARSTLIAYFVGQKSDAADAFSQAIRIPNILQNLFGEGVLSASFIPVYAGLIGAKNRDEADRVARTVFSLIACVVSVLVLLGVLLAPVLIPMIAPGYTGPKRELMILLVRIIFPGVGLLVLSAWCLAVLNSHGRFFLSYAAPVVWNAAMIAGLIAFGRHNAVTAVEALAWGAVVGSALQVAVQFPTAWRFVSAQKERASLASIHVRTVLRNFVPVVMSRGVVQISAYIDTWFTSFLGEGAATALLNATQLNMLPISLFGMSISAAELPAMSGSVGAKQDPSAIRVRVERAQKTIVALAIPSAMAFIAIGDQIATVIFQRGHFVHDDARLVWAILAGSSIGLLSSTIGRIYSASFYALGDTTTPLRFAVVRIVLVAGLGYLFALPLPRALGIDPRWGTAGLTASAGMAGWVEFLLLRRALGRRVGAIAMPSETIAKAWLAAAIAAGAATGSRWLVPGLPPFLAGVLTIALYGVVYLALAQALGVMEVAELAARFGRRPR